MLSKLQCFELSNVQATGVVIGSGAYGKVEKVEMLGLECAAKCIHPFLVQDHDAPQMSATAIQDMSSKFVDECLLISTLRHPNIVQFLGIWSTFPGSRLPAIVMELLTTNLHDLLEPDPQPQVLPYVPLGLKHSILLDVARGLQYLHLQTRPIIHRDLSAKNVLLSSAMVAKIADMGMARIISHSHAATTMSMAPGAGVYMPPEALEVTFSDYDKQYAHYHIKLDIFSFGVVAIFALSHTFPRNLLPHTYYNKSRMLIARTELERREVYMKKIYSQFRKDHPFIHMIEKSVHNDPDLRPNTEELLVLLHRATGEIAESERDMNKLELLQALRENSLPNQTLRDINQAESVSIKQAQYTMCDC